MISEDFWRSEIDGNPRFRTILRDRSPMEINDFGRFWGVGNWWKSMISDDFGGSEIGGNPRFRKIFGDRKSVETNEFGRFLGSEISGNK